MREPRWTAWLVIVLGGVVTVPVGAQSGSISGRVIDQQNNRPVIGAQIQVLAAGGQVAGSGTTADDGGYRVAGLSAGSVTVAVRAIGYRAASVAAEIRAGAVTTLEVVMVGMVIQLDPVVVAVGRAPEKATDAPADVSVVPTVEIMERAALSVTDLLKSLPGVDISQGGLVQSNVVARGFNNIFSGAMVTLVDNRFAAVPSLRVNVPAFFPATGDDLERIEFVLGPGAALYGPNASNGVLAMFTKSPFESEGTTVRFETGYRADSRNPAGDDLDGGYGLYRFGLRHAGTVGSKFGYKVSGEYLQGTEWKARDLEEPDDLDQQRPDLECSAEFGCRDFNLERWSVDGRLDYRPNPASEIILSFGRTNAGSVIEYTGIGAAQARDWSYSYAQLRGRWKRLFIQGFVNASNSGNDSPTDQTGSFLLREGSPIVDRSKVWAAQVQHGFDIGSRETLLYGADLIFTDPQTEGTINGRHEDDDNITEAGAYLHSLTRLSDQLELVAALRVDHHSHLEDPVVSPRAALVFNPAEYHSLRATYNRAFSTPTSNNLFLDIVASRAGPYNVRALGVPEEGFTFRGYCGAGGVDNLCMRSPFVPTSPVMPALAAPLWPVAVGAVAAANPALGPALALVPNPTPDQVGTRLRTLQSSGADLGSFIDVLDLSTVRDVERIQPTISNVFEIGYKGIVDGRFRLSASGWYERKENFVGPLIVESPNVFLDPAGTLTHLKTYLTPILIFSGMPPAQAAVVTAQVAAGMAGISGNKTVTGVPLGTVVPNSPFTNTSDIFLTYRNFGEVDLYGMDLAVDYLFGDRWSLSGTYSWVSDDYFAAADVKGPTDIALNASKSKGSITGRYRDEEGGLSAELRTRYVKGFPVNSGVYVSPVNPDGSLEPIDSYGLVDAQVAWRLPFAQGLMATLTVENLFNANYTTFVGLPQLGRLILTKFQYAF
jgi:iron complex outermembrane receptor protein